MTCPICGNKADMFITAIRGSRIVSGCDDCVLTGTQSPQNDSAKYNRDRDREDHRQDIVQQFEGRDYIRARGIDRAREVGYSDEDIRQLY